MFLAEKTAKSYVSSLLAKLACTAVRRLPPSPSGALRATMA
jgi:hypothetical protein